MGRRATARLMNAGDCANDFAARVAGYLSIADISATTVGNLVTQIGSVGEGVNRVPVSINSSEPENAWVCSPHTTYSRYSMEEFRRFGRPLFVRPCSALFDRLDAYLWHAGLDDAVAINNWLVSTNLYPDFHELTVRQWTSEALDRWPRHAIWFRSLNTRYTREWLAELVRAGFMLIPSRQVYLYDQINLDEKKPQNLRRDLDLLRKTGLRASHAGGWDLQDFERAAQLYAMLYLNKYSLLNPAYSARFLQAWHTAGLLELGGLRDDAGRLQAVVGIFGIGSTITAPIVGYDTQLPQRLGLYRMSMAMIYRRAGESGCRINLSAGAAHFKRLRGGIGTLEYSAVYARHLSRRKRRALALLACLARGIGQPVMRWFQL